MTQTPDDQGSEPTAPASAPAGAAGELDMNLLKFPFLISGIFNAISALCWLMMGVLLIMVFIGCAIIPLAIAAGVLAVFEILTFVALHSEKKPRPTKKKLRLLAIFEICSILLLNVPSVACGIWTLLQLEKYDENA